MYIELCGLSSVEEIDERGGCAGSGRAGSRVRVRNTTRCASILAVDSIEELSSILRSYSITSSRAGLASNILQTQEYPLT